MSKVNLLEIKKRNLIVLNYTFRYCKYNVFDVFSIKKNNI
jgi:hypothetical protein